MRQGSLGGSKPKRRKPVASTEISQVDPLVAAFSFTRSLVQFWTSYGVHLAVVRRVPANQEASPEEGNVVPPAVRRSRPVYLLGMRSTKIVATIGPASRNPGTLERMIAEGMDVARLNFAHGTPEDHAE